MLTFDVLWKFTADNDETRGATLVAFLGGIIVSLLSLVAVTN